ncbi:MAG: hypothetical protein PHX83_16060 [Acidobacteriia bacterium]|nr:hypothetical protein [Terriglobia bacterium]
MKVRFATFTSWILGVLLVAGTTPLAAQSEMSASERAQIQKSIQIVEGVLNTVRVQSLLPMDTSSDEEVHVNYFSPGESGRRCEGIYLDNYGVIFEVYLPSFSEQRSFSLIVSKPAWSSNENKVVVNPPAANGSSRQATSVSSKPPATPAKTATPEATLDTLSKMIDAYNMQSQRVNRDAALRDFLEKLRASNIFLTDPLMGSNLFFGPSTVRATFPDPETQRKRLQDALLHAVADYGANIPHLQPGQFITILMKAPSPRDFSLFTPETRTSTIIRFNVKDLEDYKTGRIKYADLVARTKVQDN